MNEIETNWVVESCAVLTLQFLCYNMCSNVILTVFRAGNSDVVALNQAFKDKYGFKTGAKVQLEDTGEGILIRPVRFTAKIRKNPVDGEFKKWLKEAMKEDAGILDDLA